MTWPAGPQGRLDLLGRARDLLTGANPQSPTTLVEEIMHAVVSPSREVVTIDSLPPRDYLSQLAGVGAVAGFRRTLAAVAPQEVAGGTPLALLLDDIPGATIVSRFAQQQWSTDSDRLADGTPNRRRAVVDTCTGLRAGSSALNADGTSRRPTHMRTVGPLPRADDPSGWHPLPRTDGMSMRRARLVDVWVDDVIHIEALFQDSCTGRDGRRTAIHEYALTATAEVGTGRLLTLSAEAGNLPYDECPLARSNLDRLIGGPLAGLRASVAKTLAGAAGCTHLNDALRGLTDVPGLIRALGPAHTGYGSESTEL